MRIRVLPLLLLVALAASGTASAQTMVRDTLDLTITPLTYFEPYGQNLISCAVVGAASFPDPLGQGRDGDYRYFSFLDGSPRTFRYAPDVPERYGDPGDIPGERISYTMTVTGGGCTNDASTIARGTAFIKRLSGYATYDQRVGPLALFDWEQTDGLTVRFDGTASRVVTPQGRRPVASHSWSYGSPSTTAVTEHTFQQPGDYDVTLTVTDNDGNEDSLTRTVTVTSHQLTVKALPLEPDRLYSLGDTIIVETTVTNTGASSVLDVTVPPYTELLYDVPAAPPGTQESGPRLTRLQTREPETRGVLGQGESIVTRDSFRVDRYRSYVDANRVAEVVEFQVWAEMPGRIEASSGGEEDVLIRRPCKDGACATVTVGPAAPFTVEIEVSTVDGPTAQATSGRRPYTGAFGNTITDHRLTRLREGVLCISGCVNVTVRVTDADGDPVEGAAVNLTSGAVTGAGVVTPDQGGGLVCDDEVIASCGRPQALAATDSDGEAHGFYYVPGVIAQVSATLLANVEVEGEGTESATADLQILPSRVEVGRGTIMMHPDDVTPLRIAGIARLGLSAPGAIGDKCKALSERLLGATPVVAFDSEYLKATKTAADYVCGGAIDSVLGETVGEAAGEAAGKALLLLDAGKKLAEFAEVYWFYNTFEVPSLGLGTIGIASPAPPFIDSISDFNGAINALMSKVYTQHLLVGEAPGPLTLEIFEVSYVRAVTAGGEGLDDKVPALYLRISEEGGTITHTALVREGYRPGFWLTEQGVSATTIDAPAAAGDVSLTAGSATRVRSTGHETGAPFDVGHVVTLSPSEPTAESVQIAAVEGSTLSLTAPLRFAHPSGAVATRIDSLAVGVPPAPVPTTWADEMPGAPSDPTLAWVARVPSATFDVEVARDAAFSELVADADGTVASTLALSGLADGRYVWRVRASNLLGDGPWSGTFSFTVGPPPGDALARAIPLGGTLPVLSTRWSVAATVEAGEAAPSCGADSGSLWYSLTPSASGLLVVDTYGSLFDTVLSVWTGSGHPLAEIACDDDSYDSRGAAGLSRVDLDATAGVPILIRVSGRDGAEGLLSLRVGQDVTVDTERTAPTALALSAPYPNPARSASVAVSVELPEPGPVRLAVYDALGREVAVAWDGPMGAGRQSVTLDTSRLPAGVYVVRLVAGAETAVQRLTVLR